MKILLKSDETELVEHKNISSLVTRLLLGLRFKLYHSQCSSAF